MRKFLLAAACLMLLMIVPALAQTYTFQDIHATVDIPSDYSVVLTPYNLSANSAYLAEQGLDYDATMYEFETEGILLKAIDAKNSRTLVITALQDVDGQTYFDLNEQDEDMRKEFRVSHTDGSAYGLLGYNYSTAKWANYRGNELRFLQSKYSLIQEGKQVCTGYQRRTIRNGYTITLDMQVTGRSARDADNSALEKVMRTFKFTQILPMPALPIKLVVSSAPPAETNEDTFTIKGTSAKHAKITANVVSLGSSGSSRTYNVGATASGAFSLKVTLPSQGTYYVTLTADGDGAITAQRQYAVTYQKGMLPVDLTYTPGDTLGDSTVISGSTVAGAKTQLSVSGPISYSRISTSKNFKFTVDTSAEGTYQFVLTVTKKGMQEKMYRFEATRSFSDGDRISKIKSSAKKMTYDNLSKAGNAGKTVSISGYITSVTPVINEWVVTVAMSKNGSSYRHTVYVISSADPQLAVDSAVRIYAKVSDHMYSELGEDGKITNYPRLEAYFFEAE